MQLTDAEAAFRIHKSDLRIRPIWHQRQDRVEAHILVCFLAYVLWRTLGQMCQQKGLGDEPRRVIDELSQIRTDNLCNSWFCRRVGRGLRSYYVAKKHPSFAVLRRTSRYFAE